MANGSESFLILRSQIISDSFVVSPTGLRYYLSPFDGNGADYVTF